MKYYLWLSLFIFLAAYKTIAQERLPDGGGGLDLVQTEPCLSDRQRAEVISMLNTNLKSLSGSPFFDSSRTRDARIIAFDWPLRASEKSKYKSYYAINNFVDRDPGPGLLDYYCTARTYNGHKGTDIDTWPFPWFQYDLELVHAIAAETGILIGKIDGNEDNHCSCSGDWNAVFLRHSDGSETWYGHLKKNSVLSKAVGQVIMKGEYLGIVASSGCSTGPHLHFEVYDINRNLIDPFQGACNPGISQSWWKSQVPYREPTLNAALTHDAIPVHGCPGTKEIPYFSNDFRPGKAIYTATYFHDQTKGDISVMRLRRPDNTIFNTWSFTAPETYTRSWWYWSSVLPQNSPSGTWRFEVDFAGKTAIHEFNYGSTTPISPDNLKLAIKLQPNPSHGIFRIEGIQNYPGKIQIWDSFGRMVNQQVITDDLIRLSDLTPGFYTLLLRTDDRTVAKPMIIF